MMSSKSFLKFILSALMAIPVLFYFWYISTYGVNVLFWDEWVGFCPFYDKLQSGTLSFADLFTQHNEHRLFFPRIIFLLLGCFSNLNTVVNMYFSALLLVFTLAIIFYSYIRFFGYSEKSLLGFIPVPFLLFSFVQYENTLWGFQIAWYMLILFSVLSFVLLENIERGYILLVLAIISGVIASYSSLQGILVWPVGIVYFIFRGASEKDNRLFWLKISLSWTIIALLVVSLYFVNYHKPGYDPSIFFIFLHPVDGLKYFLSLISGIVPLQSLSGAIILGSLLLVFYFYVILRVFKLRGVSLFYLPILLIFFSLFFDIINTIGRSGLGIGCAFVSRYTSFNLIGVIGIYLALLTFTWAGQQSKIGRKANIKNSIALIILLLIIFSQIFISYSYGLEWGKNIKIKRTEGAYALLNYEKASDDTIERTLFPNAKKVKKFASLCKKYKLNVFSNPPKFAYFQSNLTLSSEPTLCSIETLNGLSINLQKQPLVIKATKKKEIVIEGWAVDKEASDVASAVFINIDDEINIPAIYGIDKKDVSKHFKNVRYRFSGYRTSFSASIIEEGEHKFYLKIISNDGTRYFKSPEVKFYIEYIAVAEGYGFFRVGQWCVDKNMNLRADTNFVYGTAGDIPVVGDFNGDGSGDYGVFRNGQWFIDTTGDQKTNICFGYGTAGDVPVVGDFNQDGEDDYGVFRDGHWYVDTNRDHRTDITFRYGKAGDTPVVGDINQDEKDDTAVFKDGQWWVDTNFDHCMNIKFTYGDAGDKPVVGDINQDGVADYGVFRNGDWYIDTDGDQKTNMKFKFGTVEDIPVVGEIG